MHQDGAPLMVFNHNLINKTENKGLIKSFFCCSLFNTRCSARQLRGLVIKQQWVEVQQAGRGWKGRAAKTGVWAAGESWTWVGPVALGPPPCL